MVSSLLQNAIILIVIRIHVSMEFLLIFGETNLVPKICEIHVTYGPRKKGAHSIYLALFNRSGLLAGFGVPSSCILCLK